MGLEDTTPTPAQKRTREDPGAEVDNDAELQNDLKLAKAAVVGRPSKRQRVVANRSLFIRSLPPSATDESLTEFVSQHYPVKHSIVVVDPKTKTSRGYGFVTLADPDDTQEAVQKFDKAKWEGRHLRVEIAEPRQRKKDDENDNAIDERKLKRKLQVEEACRPSKLIVRNLPWSIKKSEQLATLFQSFGKVKFADLPNTQGKLKGFGFVTMRRKKCAEKAVEVLNGKEIDGRSISVHWAVDKAVWENRVRVEDAGDEKKPEATNFKSNPTNQVGSSTIDKDLEAFFKNHMENLESESEEDEENENSDGGGEDEEGDDLMSDQDRGGEHGEATEKKQPLTDNRSTVFVRNLPYTATDDELKSFFRHFGGVRYARVVVDKTTGRAAGTGFVCFFNESDSKACVKGSPRPQAQGLSPAVKNSILQDENLDPEGKYSFQGRILHVTQAVSKEEASRFGAEKDKGREKDKRRLFLLQEGKITTNSPLGKLLNPAELKMRDEILSQQNKTIHRNPLLHISLTRLIVRNLPRNFTSRDLKELARKAVVGFAVDVKEGRRQPLTKDENRRGGENSKEGEHQRRLKGKGVVKQAKITFETKEGGKATVEDGAKSRGFGFIEYSSHRWALMGLRWLNGYQMADDKGKKRHLMVQFAIDNAKVLNRRETPQKTPRQSGMGASQKDTTQHSAPKPGHAESTSGMLQHGRRAKQESVDDSSQGKKDSRRADLEKRLIARKRMTKNKKAMARAKP